MADAATKACCTGKNHQRNGSGSHCDCNVVLMYQSCMHKAGEVAARGWLCQAAGTGIDSCPATDLGSQETVDYIISQKRMLAKSSDQHHNVADTYTTFQRASRASQRTLQNVSISDQTQLLSLHKYFITFSYWPTPLCAICLLLPWRQAKQAFAVLLRQNKV